MAKEQRIHPPHTRTPAPIHDIFNSISAGSSQVCPFRRRKDSLRRAGIISCVAGLDPESTITFSSTECEIHAKRMWAFLLMKIHSWSFPHRIPQPNLAISFQLTKVQASKKLPSQGCSRWCTSTASQAPPNIALNQYDPKGLCRYMVYT